ncbi:hypothetical protein K8W59_06655 [Nocardioides rotundus]|uniref:hypothetical protein n=1 Tax=Nocardioides rotundus TaxID=1774216 RepID=UPI001CBE2BFF|nr:hypothetical protein [Nocardioides rotundus]UAL31146.1 hypothetical protein K8W59_06655 [Nocardioides rotundus]
MRSSEFNPDLLAHLEKHCPAGSIIPTISSGAPNRIAYLRPIGIGVETDRSRSRGDAPQLVPAWMVDVAWRRLHERGSLTNRELLASEGLNVKRSSFVCALLAQLPGIVICSHRPIALELSPR